MSSCHYVHSVNQALLARVSFSFSLKMISFSNSLNPFYTINVSWSQNYRKTRSATSDVPALVLADFATFNKLCGVTSQTCYLTDLIFFY